MKRAWLWLVIGILGAVCQALLPAQAIPPLVAEQGYADLLLVSGKIVAMDDRTTVPETPGHIFQAMAIKGKRIMALGTNDEMKLLAGPKTQVIDLGGKTVIPGLIQPHYHVRGEASSQYGPKVGLIDPSVNLQVVAETTAEGTAKKVRDTVVNAIQVRKIPKGQWITVNVRENKQNLSGTVGTWFWLYKINRRQFDSAIPDNPIKLSGGYTGMFNAAAIAEFKKQFPEWEDSADWENGQGSAAAGVAAVPETAALEFELWWKDVPVSAIAEMYRLHGEQHVVKHGVTSMATVEFSPRNVAAFALLNREGKMPYRLAYFIQTHRGLQFNKTTTAEFIKAYGASWTKHTNGAEMLWLNGFGNEMWDGSDNSVCMGPDVAAPPEIKERERCPVPGTKSFESYKLAVINGWRPAQSHNTGSHGSRLFIQMLEEGMKEGGYSLEYMRSLRPTVEHCQVIGTPPDVMAGFKKFGIIVDVTPNRLEEIPSLIKAYGEKIRPFAMPVKSYINMGIRVTMEADGADVWTPLHRLVTRQTADKNTREKFVLVPEEAIDRVSALKMSTTWASEYLMAEDTIGTLESGKYADFVVLDRDFFTIPVDDILNINAAMTGVNGKIVYDSRISPPPVKRARGE